VSRVIAEQDYMVAEFPNGTPPRWRHSPKRKRESRARRTEYRFWKRLGTTAPLPPAGALLVEASERTMRPQSWSGDG
jgi:hypothetical protein